MRKNRLLLIGPALLGCAVAGYALYSWWHTPSIAVVNDSTHATSDVLGASTALQTWQTSYFITRIPADLEVKTTTEDSYRPIMGNYLLTSISPQQQDQVGVTVGALDGNLFASVSAIKYRLQHPELYTQVSRSYAPPGAYVFSRSDINETGIFWQNGERYAEVVVSGSGDRTTDLEQALQAIVTNWQWL